MRDKPTKQAKSIDVAIPNSHNLHCTNIERLQKCADLKEELTRIWKLKTAYIILLVLSTGGIIPNRLYDSLKQLNLRPALCILMQKAVTLYTCRTVRNFSAEQQTKSAWSVRPAQFENRLNCCELIIIITIIIIFVFFLSFQGSSYRLTPSFHCDSSYTNIM
jgi:hypothetical protein